VDPAPERQAGKGIGNHKNTLFHLIPLAGDPLGYAIELVDGQEMQYIVRKYEDILHYCKDEVPE